MLFANTLLMIRPACFGFNSQTAQSNSFQNKFSSLSQNQIQQNALREFENLKSKITGAGVEVVCIDDTDFPVKPDAVFPNNWFSTHADGTLILYPMLTENRRLERREDIVEFLKKNFEVKRVRDLSPFEKQNKILEGTGSLVFDNKNKIIYCSISPRSSKELAEELSKHAGYEIIFFHTKDSNGYPIYHTNVLLTIANGFAVICTEVICDKIEKEIVITALRKSGLEIVSITLEQMNKFAGNLLQAENKDGSKILLMSASAFNIFSKAQLKVIEKFTNIVYSDISTIENIGGGSVRCMLAEIFFKRSK